MDEHDRDPDPGRATDSGPDDSIRNRALARIALRPPYFGLGAMEQRGSGVVSAMVPVDPPRPPERGPVEAAQVARHLAILGSCAAALSRDDDAPHHYLAATAHYARLAGGPTSIVGGMLQAEAVASWVDRRTARALVKLATLDGQGLHLLDVTYAVMTPKMFHRLNPPVEVPPVEAAPAEVCPVDGLAPGRVGGGTEPGRLDGDIVEIGPDGIRIDCGPIPAEVCAGHFPDYPAAPVAIVMGQLCRAAGQGLAARIDRDLHYQIEEGHVTASGLARAGQRLELEASYRRRVPAGHLMAGAALADGEVVGRVEVTLSSEHAGARTEAA